VKAKPKKKEKKKRSRSIIRDDDDEDPDEPKKRKLEEIKYLSQSMGKFLSVLFENARPTDIAQVRKSFPPVKGVNDTDSVSKQIRFLVKNLIGFVIPQFIEILKEVVDKNPSNRVKILIDKYKENLEEALLAENYDINEQRRLLCKKLATAKTRKRLSPTAIIIDADLSIEEINKKFEKRKEKDNMLQILLLKDLFNVKYLLKQLRK
jgi:hypothetical protein